MKVLITGSSGHVGGAIARRLHAHDHEVVGVSRRRDDSLPRDMTQHALDIGDACFVEKARAAIGQCDAVIHTAACLDETMANTELSRINCLGTQQTICLARQLGVACLVYVSGFNILGLPQQHPVTEAHPIAPANIYAASKLYGECLTTLANSPAMRTVSLRVSSPVGPGLKRPRIFRLFVERALRGEAVILNGAGGRRQDYVDVRDVARAAQAALEGDCSGIFNIASGQPVSNLELARRCVAALCSQSEIVFSGNPDPHDAVVWDISITAARDALGFAPAYSLEDSAVALADEISGHYNGDG